MTHPEPRGVKCLQTGGTGETTRASLKKISDISISLQLELICWMICWPMLIDQHNTQVSKCGLIIILGARVFNPIAILKTFIEPQPSNPRKSPKI